MTIQIKRFEDVDVTENWDNITFSKDIVISVPFKNYIRLCADNSFDITTRSNIELSGMRSLINSIVVLNPAIHNIKVSTPKNIKVLFGDPFKSAYYTKHYVSFYTKDTDCCTLYRDITSVSHLDLEQFRKYYKTISIPQGIGVLNIAFLSMYGQQIQNVFVLENEELYHQFDDTIN